VRAAWCKAHWKGGRSGTTNLLLRVLQAHTRIHLLAPPFHHEDANGIGMDAKRRILTCGGPLIANTETFPENPQRTSQGSAPVGDKRGHWQSKSSLLQSSTHRTSVPVAAPARDMPQLWLLAHGPPSDTRCPNVWRTKWAVDSPNTLVSALTPSPCAGKYHLLVWAEVNAAARLQSGAKSRGFSTADGLRFLRKEDQIMPSNPGVA